MLCTALMSMLLLQLTARAAAVPAPMVSSSADTILPNSPVASTPNPSQNASTVIKYAVENSPLTLFIQTNPSDTIARTNLVTTLYYSRDYIRQQIAAHGNSSLPATDDPFNSTTLAPATCVLVAGTGVGARQRLTYGNLGDVVQGLMDKTLYPFQSSVDGLTFAIYHAVYGFVGSGALSTGSVAPPVQTS